MTAYLLADVEVLNEEAYAEYRQKFDPILTKYGGRILINGGPVEAMEGNWLPRRLVVLEFPSVSHAKGWYTSPEYREITPIRLHHATTHFVTLADGYKQTADS